MEELFCIPLYIMKKSNMVQMNFLQNTIMWIFTIPGISCQPIGIQNGS